jgi:hypothetical protein
MFKYLIKRKGGRWRVLRPEQSLPKLECEAAGYLTMTDAMQALNDELKNRGMSNYDKTESLQRGKKD